MHTTNTSSGAGGLPRHTCSWLSMGAHGDRRRVALARYGYSGGWNKERTRRVRFSMLSNTVRLMSPKKQNTEFHLSGSWNPGPLSLGGVTKQSHCHSKAGSRSVISRIIPNVLMGCLSLGRQKVSIWEQRQVGTWPRMGRSLFYLYFKYF